MFPFLNFFVADHTALEQKLGIRFQNPDLLIEALTHRSYINEHPSWRLPHNERLEFLGDAVLELASTRFLFEQFPHKPEGELTSFRAALVNTDALAEVATALGLDQFILLSRGEAAHTGKAKKNILADALEALIGALYRDQGYETAEGFIAQHILAALESVLSTQRYRDPKSVFQEKAQAHVSITPVYQVVDEWGPDHDKRFLVGVFLGDERVATGEGASKQEAETNAAREGLTVKGWNKK
ncbi:MAG: ribonuclease III [Patescibacteria group bacterium]|nr:ribonuclease III [Patescibacteria group bacterium]MDE2438059.1 ribonuclease III [Patescibacteria group bacterium]